MCFNKDLEGILGYLKKKIVENKFKCLLCLHIFIDINEVNFKE
jgi:hypothetical protein